MRDSSTRSALYRERLTVPIAWWVLSGLFALSMLLAFGFYLGPVWGVGSGVLSFVVVAGVFSAAATPIVVGPDRLRVGRANIGYEYLGDAQPLDAAQARLRRGRTADARAFLVLRPYIPTAVEVAVLDVDDPAPYWLVASRRPRTFATALTQAMAARATVTPQKSAAPETSSTPGASATPGTPATH